jgi:gamma-glutamyl-gamma-aminobutyrate hydrolase PuuD
MSANDTLDWVRREIKWLETPLAEDKPLLGLCLGAQMLARGCSATTTSVARLAITRSIPRSLAIGYAPPRSRARSIKGILTASICLKVPSSSLLVGLISQTKPMVKARMQSACSSTRKSPIT